MKKLNRLYLLLGFWAALAGHLASASVCPRLLLALPQFAQSAVSFWGQTNPYKAGLGAEALPFKFGFDAELWHIYDVVNIVSKDAASLTKLDAQLRQAGPFYTAQELVSMLVLTNATQLSSFVRATPANGKYVLTDVTVAGLKRWKHTNAVKSQYASILQPFADTSLKARQIPVTAVLETDSGAQHDQAVELVMDGALDNPAAFKQLIDWLYTETEFPETHFHVSLPLANVSPEQTIYAARALETKILLELMLSDRDFNGETYHPHDDSSFTKNVAEIRRNEMPQVERGIVRVESERWGEPDAHDVEIREWIEKDHGLENMYFLMQMVRYSNHLRSSRGFQSTPLRDTMPPNLNGALRYAAFMLKDRLPAANANLAPDLIKLAEELEAAGKLTDPLRKKVRDYLSQNDVLKYLSPNVFMKEDVFFAPPAVRANTPAAPVVEGSVPLPAAYLVGNTRIKFKYADEDQSVVRIPTRLMEHGSNAEFLADFKLDFQKPFRSGKYAAVENEKVAFFDWVEPNLVDQAKVSEAAREVMKQAFNHFKVERVVAASDGHYGEAALTKLGFTLIPGIEHGSTKRWELKRAAFR